MSIKHLLELDNYPFPKTQHFLTMQKTAKIDQTEYGFAKPYKLIYDKNSLAHA